MFPKCEDGGKLILRLVLGLLILFHGVWKLQHGVGFIGDMLVKHGLPGALGYLVYIGEVVAPLMIVLGILGRFGALIIVINMVVAVALVHTGQLFTANPKTGGYALELDFMYLFGALSLLASGMGRFVIGGSRLN
ncbi:MAG: DoxX family protein [Bordetella sp.]|uniref:DoxX family protein n=1 Tax=Bordetella sp. TaxID=28081 RepID=UPI003F7B84FD